MAAPLRRVRAGQRHQPLFDISFDLHLVWPGRLETPSDRSFQPTGDELLADPANGPWTAPESIDDRLIGLATTVRVRQEEDAGVGQAAGGGLAGGHQLLQPESFVRRQRHPILKHGGLRACGGANVQPTS